MGVEMEPGREPSVVGRDDTPPTVLRLVVTLLPVPGPHFYFPVSKGGLYVGWGLVPDLGPGSSGVSPGTPSDSLTVPWDRMTHLRPHIH